MNELFVPEDIAAQLKEIGFDEPCFAGYQDNGKLFYKSSNQTGVSSKANVYGKYCHQNNHVIKAPLYQQVFGWFRDNHDLLSMITPKQDGFSFTILNLSTRMNLTQFDERLNGGIGKGGGIVYNDYHDAQIARLEYLISLIKG